MLDIKELSFAKTQELVEGWGETLPNDFDHWQRPTDYKYFIISDLAYWDAIVAYSVSSAQVEAVKSQVISLKEGNEIMQKYFAEQQEKKQNQAFNQASK